MGNHSKKNHQPNPVKKSDLDLASEEIQAVLAKYPNLRLVCKFIYGDMGIIAQPVLSDITKQAAPTEQAAEMDLKV